MGKLTLFEVRIPLVDPFRTSFGTQTSKAAIILKYEDDSGNVGWAETSLEEDPGYCYETTTTAWYIQEKYLIPKFLEFMDIENYNVDELLEEFRFIRGHDFAKSGLEALLWSYKSQLENKPLSKLYGGTKTEIPTGVSIGIQKSIPDLIERITGYLEQGYQRMKIKITPGWDYQVIKEIRNEFGDIQLMVDANSAYTLSDNHVEILSKLDKYDLMMIEQPLDYQDLLMHQKLQKKINTPICLDESIHTVADAILAIEQECCRIINIKPGRVGGYSNAIEIAKRLGKGTVWCGGMLETGVGRLHNLALQSRSEFTIPGDTSGSKRYFEKDVIDPPVEVNSKGYIHIPTDVNLGHKVQVDIIKSYTIKEASFT
jgi:o-succinylbenzoate synthase